MAARRPHRRAAVLDTARRVFELHGFASLETRAVEPLEQMLRKGEIDKEVYLLRRLHAAEGEADAGLGLHFDLTVPFARYVLENAGHLEFPFRRYQIQKSWRGERPQEGRFREFTQADIDVVDRDTLAFHHDAEMAVVMATLLAELPIPRAVVQVNNRKLAEGFFRGVGAHDPAAVLRALDKLDKIGPEKVARAPGIRRRPVRRRRQRRACASRRSARPTPRSSTQVRGLGVATTCSTRDSTSWPGSCRGATPASRVQSSPTCSIARGLDYYTGTVYETQLLGYEHLGSIALRRAL